MAEPAHQLPPPGQGGRAIDVARQRGLATTPLARALRAFGRKQAIGPGVDPGVGFAMGYRSLRGRRSLPRAILNYLDAYGGTDDSVVWVYACASLIAETMSGFPWDVLDPEDKVLDPAQVPQELADLLDRPNRLLTYEDFITWVMLDLELGGNSYWLKDRRNGLGQPFELIRLRPELVRRAVDQQGRPAGHVYMIGGRQIPYGLDEVLWYRYPDPRDELYGIGTVEAIQRELGADLAAREHVVGFYSQGGRISGVVTVQGGLSPLQWDRLEEQMEEDALVVGTDFRLLLIEQGQKFEPITQAPGDTNVVPLQRMTKDRILAGFKVPEPLLGGVLENANYKITDSRYVFAQRLKPKATRVSTRTTIDLVDAWDGLQFRMDVQEDEQPAERATRVKDMRGSGPSLNELRDGLGLPPIDDELADEPLLAADLLPASVVIGLQEHPATQQPITNVTLPGGVAPTGATVPPGQGPGAGDNEPLPDAPPADAGPTQAGTARRTLPNIKAPRPRTPLERRVRRSKSRFDVMGDDWVPPHVVHRATRDLQRRAWGDLGEAVAAARASLGTGGAAALPPAAAALPPSPQEQGYPLVVPPLPEGYEQLGQVIVLKANPAIVVRLLAHRHGLLTQEYAQWRATLHDFFVAQRGRVLQSLHNQFTGSQRGASGGRKKAKGELHTDAIWDDNAERDALLAVYLPMAERVGGEALKLVGEMLGSSIRWDLATPAVQHVRDRVADLVTRVNDTTRQGIAQQVDVGLQRGYSVVQIANGVPAEDYNGIVGVFDQASRYRAEMIARTETAFVYNLTANEGYRDAGVAEVEVIDGMGDDECASANGATWSLDEAAADPIAHPNCVRAFAPIVGGKAAPRPQPKALRGRQLRDAHVVTEADLGDHGMMCGGCDHVFSVGEPYMLEEVGPDVYLIVCTSCGAPPSN